MEPYVPGEEPSQPDLRKIFPPGAEAAARADGAGRAGGVMGQPESGAPPPAPGEAPVGAAVRGRVSVAPELAARVPGTGVLFIIARSGGASGPPVAVKRVDSPRLPLEFEIGPGDRMIPTAPFTGPFALSARLDGDGNATTRSAGDLQGAAPSAVDSGAEGVEIVLGEVL